ncbi:MAG: ADP-ribosylglycohydrolase family protein [Euryarchaeota archaeon]|nr:ADP-ribosylglycohydrolase family protein [Euryarchaeota archaeon]
MGLDSRIDLKAKFRGALLGSAVGDALGAPVEGYDMEMVRSVYGGEWEMTYGRYTDDTEMMIGVAESLIENKGFNGADMALKFIQNYNVKRGYGPGSKEVLRRIREGESLADASGKLFGGRGSYGNGAAMRIAPVGLFYFDTSDMLWEIAYKSSNITHSHELGKAGAALQALAVALAMRGQKEDMLLKLKEVVKTDMYKGKVGKLKALLDDGATEKRVISELGNGVEAFESVPTAIYSFLRSDNFKDSVVYAISLGGDTDTIGAMTGAISGAYYGEAAIPKAWLERLEDGEKGRRYIKKLADDLCQIKLQLLQGWY